MMIMIMNTLYESLNVSEKVIRDFNIRVHTVCSDFCYDSKNTHKLIPWRFLEIRRDVRQGMERMPYKIHNKVAVDVNTEILKYERAMEHQDKRYEAIHSRRKQRSSIGT
jgi:hypothetical protein